MDTIIQGNDQNGVIIQVPTAAELNAVAEVKESEGGSRSVGVVIPASEALTKNVVKLSKQKKLRVAHQGFKENAISLRSEPTYAKTTVTLDNGETVEAMAYVAPETRNVQEDPYAKTGDDFEIQEAGTFSIVSGYQCEDEDKKLGYFESVRYDQNAISVSTSGDSLIQPVPALAADEELAQQIDTTYRKGQNLFTPITKDNYLSRPGMEVNTDDTFLAQQEKEEEETEGEE